MSALTADLGRFVVAIHSEQLPAAALPMVRNVFTDTVGVIAAAAAAHLQRLSALQRAPVLSLRSLTGRDEKTTHGLCADAHGFGPHAASRCGVDQRKQLERLCRYITRRAIANDRFRKSAMSTLDPKFAFVGQDPHHRLSGR